MNDFWESSGYNDPCILKKVNVKEILHAENR
jgi:hypothetical protein